MSTATLIGLVVTLVAISLLISAACYTLLAKWFRAEKPTLRRGLAVAAFSVTASILMSVWLQLATNAIETNPGLSLLAMFLVNLIVPILVTAGAFRTSIPRALGIFLGASLLGGGITFVMALALKATVVETFVIPTGSMAPTIRGAHMERTCRNCGREMIVGMTGEAIQGPHEMRPRGVEVDCINCGQVNPVASDGDDMRGERIAVDKTADVERWDLVVFRKPDEPTVNYVKRFVGLPHEKIEWYGGELFANGELLRKPPEKMESLWFPVNDSAFVSKEPTDRRWVSDEDGPRWQRDNGQWSATANDNESVRMRFKGPIDDSFEYNNHERHREHFHVPDVMLRLTGLALSDGELEIEWKGRDFTVSYRINSESIRQRVRYPTPPGHEIGGQWHQGSLLEKGPLEFAVRDGQAYVRQADKVLFNSRFGPTTIAEFRQLDGRTVANTCELSIAAHGGTVSVERIELFRDIYYLSPNELGAAGLGSQEFIEEDGSIALGSAEYLALGDNPSAALDSRFWGPVGQEKIIGIVKWLYWPPSRAQEFE